MSRLSFLGRPGSLDRQAPALDATTIIRRTNDTPPAGHARLASCLVVIASEAKQSSGLARGSVLDCVVAAQNSVRISAMGSEGDFRIEALPAPGGVRPIARKPPLGHNAGRPSRSPAMRLCLALAALLLIAAGPSPDRLYAPAPGGRTLTLLATRGKQEWAAARPIRPDHGLHAKQRGRHAARGATRSVAGRAALP